MADNFDFDGSIIENPNNPQNDNYSDPAADASGAFGADDTYGDFYTPDSTDQPPIDFENLDGSADGPQDMSDPQDEEGYDDFEERGIKAFLGSIGGKSKTLLIIAIALLLIFLIIFLAAGRKAKNNNNKPSEEPVSLPPVIELPSELPVTVPAESQTVQLSGGTGEYTVNTGDNTLALRPTASTEYDAILRLNSGTVVKVLFVDDFSNVNDSWGYIEYEGNAGWVNMNYLLPGAVEVTTAASSLG